jgi:hypothetical protein
MKSGERLVTQAKNYVPDMESITMIAPMEIIVRMNPMTGETLFGLGEWIPSRFLASNEITIRATDVMSIISPSEKLAKYYGHCLKTIREIPVEDVGQRGNGVSPEDVYTENDLPDLPNSNTISELLQNLPVKRTLH